MASISKIFTFDKVAYTSSRRVNLPVIEMELRDYDTDKPKLSICGELWNARHTDIVMGGQCLDEMVKLGDLRFNTLFRKLCKLWKNWHNNDLNAGTVKQEQALDDARKSGIKLNCYEDSCKYLESVGLLEDDGYKYGSSWLYREIPKDTMTEIMGLLAA